MVPGVFDMRSASALFHGTGERFEGEPRVGCDGVFWAAESSAVAQTYIPRAPGRALLVVSGVSLDEYIRPDRYSNVYAVAKQFGPEAQDISYDQLGRAMSWRVPPGYLTGRALVEILESRFGYTNQFDGSGDWRAFVLQEGGLVRPAEWRLKGHLLILDGFEGMRLADVSTGEGDLTDLQSKKWGMFKGLADLGFDGVVIDDFCQSEVWGNVGHRAFGFFEHAARRLRVEAIEACHFEWEDTPGALRVTETPEFLEWRAGKAIEERPSPRC